MKSMKWTSVLLLLGAMACTGNKSNATGEEAAADSAAMDSAMCAEPREAETLTLEVVKMADSLSYQIKVSDYSTDEEPAPYTIETVTDHYSLQTLWAVEGPKEQVEFINQWLTLDAAEKGVDDPVTAARVAEEYATLQKEGVTDVRSAFKLASQQSLNGNAPVGDEEMMELGFVSSNEYESDVLIRWQTSKLLTLWLSGSMYLAGAAHGMPWEGGRTFDLVNLRVLTLDDIITKAGQKPVLKMIVKELKDEYADSWDMDKPDSYFGFPASAPSLTKEGVSFDYGAYEIGPYAMGMPGVVLPYEKLQPYLTDEVKQLLKESE